MVTLWASPCTCGRWPKYCLMWSWLDPNCWQQLYFCSSICLMIVGRELPSRCNERLSMTALNWQTMQDTNLNAAIDRTSHCVNRSHLATSPGLAVNFFTAITMTIIIGWLPLRPLILKPAPQIWQISVDQQHNWEQSSIEQCVVFKRAGRAIKAGRWHWGSGSWVEIVS